MDAPPLGSDSTDPGKFPQVIWMSSQSWDPPRYLQSPSHRDYEQSLNFLSSNFL